MMLSGAIFAQDDAEESDAETAELNLILVTGSRIKRTDIEGPAPIIVIDQEELAERGYTTVYEALADLTINNGFKFEGPETTNGFSPDVQTLNLRGFGVGETLTLINGRRLTNYPAAYQSNATVFNYGSIPVAAIERIEILATGASAIYGSDAVAGVINIILRQDINDTTIDALWGTPTGTDSTRGDTRIQLVTGKTYNRGSYTLTGEYAKRKSILGRFYSEFDNQQDDYPYGQGVYNRSILNLDMWKNYGFSPGLRYIDPAETTGESGQAACDGLGGGYIYAYRANRGYFCSDPNAGAPATNFQNEKESFSAYFNGQLEIGDKGTELFTDILYYTANSKSNNDAIFVFEEIYNLTEEVYIPCCGGFYDYDWTTSQIGWNSESLGGLDLDQHYNDDAWTAVVGARGVFGQSQDWEFSANYSKYKFKFASPAMKWRETIDNLLGYNYQSDFGNSYDGSQWWSGGTLPGEELPFGIGIGDNLYRQPNQAVLDTIGTTSYDNDTSDLFLQYTMTGDLYEMKAGPLSYAFVVEYEDEDIKFVPDDLLRQAPPTTDAYGNPVAGLTG
ncbi:MAG: TonB-dependent receptor plug domain-containing protein, partial [Methylococcales bacterium]